MLLAFSIVSAQEDTSSIDQDCPPLTAEEAIEQAIEYTGFDRLPGFLDNLRCAATLGPVKDSRTPFVAEYMKNNEVWKLDFIDVPLVWRSGEVKRDFQVIIDAGTGQLLSVFSISDEVGSSDTLPEPSAMVAEQFFTQKLIFFDSLPTGTPNTSLIEAFGKCHMNPIKAKKIRVLFIGYHLRTATHGVSWIIILRGTEHPMDPFSQIGAVPVNERNSVLYSVDSETGILEFAMTAPVDMDYIRRMKGIAK